jgi:YVTN family beta-propeller protein
MHARKHPRVRKASSFFGLAMILGMMILAAPSHTPRAAAAPAQAWTAYVVNSGSNTVTPIDTSTNTAGPPIAVGNTPEGIAITPDGTTAYVTNFGDGTVTPINTATNTAGPPIAVGIHPYGIAITPNGTTAYVTNATGIGTVTPINTAANTAGPPIVNIGDTPTGIAITPNGATAYVTNQLEGFVTPINTATNTAGPQIGGFSNSFGIAITPNGKTAYVTNRDIDTVTPINTSTNTVGGSITVGYQPVGLAITPNGSTAYVTTSIDIVTPQAITDGGITPIDIATGTTGTLIAGAGGQSPAAIAITPDGATAYVAGGNILTPVNTTTDAAGTSVVVGSDAVAVAITPDQAPVAHLSVTPGEVGQPTEFDASASTVAFGTISTYAWNFGDGLTTTTSTPTTTHIYATPGPYTATVTETDSAGTSTTQVFTGQTMSRNGGPSAVASQSFTVVRPLCAAGLNAHVLTATYPAGTFTGLFCMNAKGIGTYTQGAVSGLGSVTVRNGTTTVIALGHDLALLGTTKGTRSGFIEFAPAPIKLGTFTLT